MITLNLTTEEFKVLQTLVDFHIGCEIPEWIDENAYDTVVDKVLGTV